MCPPCYSNLIHLYSNRCHQTFHKQATTVFDAIVNAFHKPGTPFGVYREMLGSPLPPTGSVSSTRIILSTRVGYPPLVLRATEERLVRQVAVFHTRTMIAFSISVSWRSPIRCTQKAIIDYRVCGLSGGESPEAGGWCLFFSARTDLDFRRTPRILLAGHVASGVPRRPPAPHAFFASRPPPSIDFVPTSKRLTLPFD